MFLCVGQVIVCTLCAFLMRTRQVWLFSAHLLPLMARACCLSLETVNTMASASMLITALQVAIFLLSNMFVPYRLARAAYREVQVTDTNANCMTCYHLYTKENTLWCVCGGDV